MPRFAKNPRQRELEATIGSIKQVLKVDNKELAAMTGIKYRTLMNRIGKGGNIGEMRLYELWAILDAAKRRGYEA